MDFAMPYMCQILREYITKIDKLQQSDAERIAEAEEQPQPPPMMMEAPLMLTAGMGPSMPPAGMMPPGPPPPMGMPFPPPQQGPFFGQF
jgi:clathrin heavy chain